MPRDYRIERISKNNIGDLIYLYQSVFGKKVTLDYLHKKYDTEYLGKCWYGHIAYDDDGTPAGYYGAIPFALTLDGKRVVAAQSGDAMTHPDHAGQGLFTRLGVATDQLLEKEGLAFVYGFPNQNSYYGYTKKLGWVHRENMQRYTLKVGAIPFEKASRAIGFIRPLYDAWADLQLPRATDTELANSAVEGEFGGTHRDPSFFRYKFFLRSRLTRIAGVLVWLKPEGGLLIGDVEVVPDLMLDKFFRALYRKARWLGINRITLQVSPGSPLDRYLSSRYEPLDSWAIGYKDYGSGLPLEKLRFTYGDLDTF